MRDSNLHQDMEYLPQREAEHLRAIFDLPELPEGTNVVHHYHHYDSNAPSLTIKSERNTKGWNVEIGVSGARTVEEAIKLLDELKAQAEARFGGGVV